MKEPVSKVQELLKETNINLKLGKRGENKYIAANKRWFCEENLKASDKKVNDHCHIRCKNRGVVHQSFELKKKSLFFCTKVFP